MDVLALVNNLHNIYILKVMPYNKGILWRKYTHIDYIKNHLQKNISNIAEECTGQ